MKTLSLFAASALAISMAISTPSYAAEVENNGDDAICHFTPFHQGGVGYVVITCEEVGTNVVLMDREVNEREHPAEYAILAEFPLNAGCTISGGADEAENVDFARFDCRL